jgi:hypothetical protein
MSETSNEKNSQAKLDDDAERREIAEGQQRLDAQSDGEGLAAEAGAGEEAGLTEG